MKLHRRLQTVWILGLVLSCLLSTAVQAADWVYTVRPGDKLWNLAEKFTGTHTRWRDLAAHNAITNPTRLEPGSRLRFPLQWLIEEPAVVRVVYARGDVRVEQTGSGVGESILGSELSIGARLITGAHSYANVQFADGSSMQIGPNSYVVFDTLSAYRDTGMVDSRIRINRGAGASAVEPQRGPGSVYRIATPLGVAAVRGTEFRTRAEDDASFVETVGGAVEFIAPAGSRAINKGFGLKVDPAGIAVEELLPAPALDSPRPMGGHEALQWQPLTGAAEYLVQIYSGPDLAQVLASARVPAPRYALAELGPGTYAFGVRGVAASGLQGLEASQPLTLQAALAAPSGIKTRQLRGSHTLQIDWQPVADALEYKVIATPVSDTSGARAITRTTTATSIAMQDLPSGTFRVEVQANAGDIASELSEPVDQRVAGRNFWGLGGIFFLIALAL